MKVNGFWKKTLCFVLAMAMVLGNASPVVAAHEHETAAEIVTEITNATIKEAEKLIDKTGLMNAADVTDTKNSLEEADSNLAGSMDNLGTAVEDAQAAIDELEGKVTKDDAAEINASLSVAYGEASSAWENAVAVSDAAVADLEKAAEAYEAANKISDEAAKVAEAELKAAQEALNAAVEATKFANDNMVSLKNEFAKATELATKWSTEVEIALAEATAKFEEAQAALNSALEALESENADLKAAIDTFKACYDAFIEAANTFKASIDKAVAAQEALDALYAEYEALKAEYETVKTEYDVLCETNSAEGYPANYEDFKALVEELIVLDSNIKSAKEIYNEYQDNEYEALMSAQKNILSDAQKTDAEKEDAAKEIARLIIEKELLKEGQTVEEADVISGEYGKADKNFFVVLSAENEVVARYTYEYDANTDVVSLFAMKSDKDYVIYKGSYYELLVEDGNYYIETEDDERVNVLVDNGADYYELVTIDKTERPDKTQFPEQVDTSFAEELGFIDTIEAFINKILTAAKQEPINVTIPGDVKVERIPVDGTEEIVEQYYVDYALNYSVFGVQIIDYYVRYDITLTQDAQTKEYSASYDYTEEVDEQLEKCLNPNHDIDHDANRDICINETHNTSEKNLHDIDGEPQCTNETHNASNKNLHDIDGEPQCTNESHNTSEKNLHDVNGVPVCSNENHINNVHEHDPNGTICVDPVHLGNTSLHDPEGNEVCTALNHYISSKHYDEYYDKTISVEDGIAGYNCKGTYGSIWNGTKKVHISHIVENGNVYGVTLTSGVDYNNPHTMTVYSGECTYNACDYDVCVYENPCTYNPCTYDPCTYIDAGKCIAQKSKPVDIIYTTFIPQAVYVMEDGSEIVCDVTEDSFIMVGDEPLYVTLTEDGEHYTYKVPMTYCSEGEFFEVNNNIIVEENSNTYNTKKNEYETAYNDALKAWKDKVGADYYEGVYEVYATKFTTLEEVYNRYSVKKAVFEEKELGTLVNLPRNIAELIELLSLDLENADVTIEAVVAAIGVLGNGLDSIEDVFAIVKAIDSLSAILPGLELDFGLDAEQLTKEYWEEKGLAGLIELPKVYETVKNSDMGQALTNPDSYKYEYFHAWLDAFTTKIEVVKNAVELVKVAVSTVEAGVTAVTEGIELAEVAVDAVLATAEKKLLEATVEVLVMANDVLNSSEEIVLSIDSIITEAQTRTEKAYLVALAEQSALSEVVLARSYADELNNALIEISSAKGMQSGLSTAVLAAEAPLATAKALYEELKALEEHEHAYKTETTAPTCTEAGCTVYTCEICTHTYEEPIKALGHKEVKGGTEDAHTVCEVCKEVLVAKHDAKKVAETAPTCTEAGKEVYECACGYTYDVEIEALGHKEIVGGEKEVHAKCSVCGIPLSKVHEYGEPDVTPATCTEDGKEVYTCECGYQYEVILYAPGHTEEKGGTKDAHTICSVCKEVLDTKHVLGEAVVNNATCTEDGSSVRTCSCGYKETEVLLAGHKFAEEFTVDTEATCTEDGSKSRHCSACSEVTDVTVIPALDHDFDEEFTVDIYANCKEGTPGSKSKHCSRCDATTEVTEIPAVHAFEEITVEATCENEGSLTKVCTACGHTDTTTLPKLGHNYSSVTVEPTCGSNGYTTYTCTRTDCGHNYVVVAENSATGQHDYNTSYTEPTCEEDGYTTYTCKVCTLTYTETANNTRLGHSYTKEIARVDATCTDAEKITYQCERCEATHVQTGAALGHDYQVIASQDATCTAEGYKTFDCSRCEDAYTETLSKVSHNFGEWVTTKEATEFEAGSKTRVCSCGHTETEVIPATRGHEYTSVVTPATCTDAGYTTYTCTCCETPDIVVVEGAAALGHTCNVEINRVAATCTDAEKITYKCVRCDVTETVEGATALGHDFVESGRTVATCEADGLVTYDCSRCNATDEEVLPMTGHAYATEFTVDVEATCETEGSMSKHCTNAGCESKTDVTAIDALGHDFGEWFTTVEPVRGELGEDKRECSRCDAFETREVEVLVTNITLDKTAMNVITGAAFYLTATVAPENVTNETVTWTTSNAEIATVSEAGLVTAVSRGVVEIRAIANDGSDVVAMCVITVENPVVYEPEDDTPNTPVEPTTPPTETTPEEVVEEVEPVVEEIEDAVEDEMEIEDEETPLAGGEDEVVIEDEETPLANGEEIVIEEEDVPLAAGNGANVGIAVAAVGGIAVVGTGAAVAANQAGLFGAGAAATSTAASAASAGTAGAGSKGLLAAIAAFFKKLFKK